MPLLVLCCCSLLGAAALPLTSHCHLGPSGPQLIESLPCQPWQRQRQCVGIPAIVKEGIYNSLRSSDAGHDFQKPLSKFLSCLSGLFLKVVVWAYPLQLLSGNPVLQLGWLLLLGTCGLIWDRLHCLFAARERKARVRLREKWRLSSRKASIRLRATDRRVKKGPLTTRLFEARTCGSRRLRRVRGQHWLSQQMAPCAGVA